MKTIKIIAGTFVILFILNYTPIAYILKENYRYRNFDNSFVIDEAGGKGFDYEIIKIRYKRFLDQHPSKAAQDRRLYRTFSIKPWYVWQWGDYLFHNERFRLPYKEPLTSAHPAS
ncbi:hypothetical protein GWR56_13830 [Mucilaginibacter sp. 14171R-50]|uniref:hypothetical protein n=1 Tax=Mucilaginibacter sp. 14171R-50 TaxID=2703789 RepID=UPI00138D770E|nr:hypothetical protein [Mucilaginibacter sp. 14171R-50]QHS56569.1 hypothetical protein GWR56_13830 [Mucilaginibacter sp. 14171R-50]